MPGQPGGGHAALVQVRGVQGGGGGGGACRDSIFVLCCGVPGGVLYQKAVAGLRARGQGLGVRVQGSGIRGLESGVRCLGPGALSARLLSAWAVGSVRIVWGARGIHTHTHTHTHGLGSVGTLLTYPPLLLTEPLSTSPAHHLPFPHHTTPHVALPPTHPPTHTPTHPHSARWSLSGLYPLHARVGGAHVPTPTPPHMHPPCLMAVGPGP